VVKAFRASAAAVKEQWQRATAIKAGTGTRLEDLRRARHALGDRLWGQLQQESDLPQELLDAEHQLRDLLQSLSFYERIPEIDQLTKRLEDAYGQRRSEAQQALAAQVQQRVAELQQAPGFAELDSERQEQLTEPLRQRAQASEGLDLVRLRDQPAMLEGVLRQQEQKAQQWAFPAQEVSTVNVRELCREPFDSAGLEEVLVRIRQRCEEELGNDRKVLLQ